MPSENAAAVDKETRKESVVCAPGVEETHMGDRGRGGGVGQNGNAVAFLRGQSSVTNSAKKLVPKQRETTRRENKKGNDNENCTQTRGV